MLLIKAYALGLLALLGACSQEVPTILDNIDSGLPSKPITPVGVAEEAGVSNGDIAAATYSTIVGSGPVIANGMSTSIITITLKDANNNPICPSVTPTFSATDTGTTNTKPSPCSGTDANGVSTCTLASTYAETKTLTIVTPAGASATTPSTVVFTSGPASSSTSTITGTTSVANSSAASTITITLRDSNGNLVSGVIPTFIATNTGSSNVYGVCSSSILGVSTCTLRSTIAETKTLFLTSPPVTGGTVTFTPR